MVDELRGLVSFFKVGLQLFIATGLSVVKWLREQNLKVFLDMKMEDTEHTILHSVKEVAKLGVTFLTIHGSGITAKVAKEASQGTDLRILSLTLLTSLGEQDLKDLFIITDYSKFKTLEDYVLWRAAQALKFGCDGLIASGQNVAVLRKKFGSDPLIISPGIRPQGEAHDDHKRPSTPHDAITSGADYIVVGRSIRNARNRRQKAHEIIDEIDSALRTPKVLG